jgi:hypothetical protein
MRLIDRNGQEMYTMTPLSGMTFTFETFYEPWEKLQEEDWTYESIEQVSDDDRRAAPGARDGRHRRHGRQPAPQRGGEAAHHRRPDAQPEERQARKKGRFISFAGLVYGKLQEGRERRRRQGRPMGRGGDAQGARVYVGIDPGLRHMAAVVFCYLTWDNELVVFDELAIKDQTIEQVCEGDPPQESEWKVIPRGM